MALLVIIFLEEILTTFVIKVGNSGSPLAIMFILALCDACLKRDSPKLISSRKPRREDKKPWIDTSKQKKVSINSIHVYVYICTRTKLVTN